MKRKTRKLIDRARESLIVGVEVFNRPSDIGRAEGVLLMMNHAFEMLFKAVVFEKTGRIRAKREKYNYGFEKCLAICQTQINVLDDNEALSLKNLNGFRDAAAHDLVEISEGLLYAHTQQAVLIFGAVLKRAFNKDLAKWLPRRILPLTSSLPTEITAIVDQDMTAISGMLSRGRRREDDAEARLRPYQVMEKNIRESQGGTSKVPTSEQLVQKLKKGDWKTALPMVAGLVQPDTGGIPISLNVTKKTGFPVKIDPNASAAIAFKYAGDEDRYPNLTGELAGKLEIKPWQVVQLAKLFKMKGNADFHKASKISKASFVQRYSEKARQVMAAAIERDGVATLCAAAKASERRDPDDYPINNADGRAVNATATSAAR
jgi:Domain of unknown function (DUF3644)